MTKVIQKNINRILINICKQAEFIDKLLHISKENLLFYHLKH